MPRKGLSILEALEVFRNLYSDIETDELSLSEAEDIMSEKSSSSENTDIDEEVDDISVPGPSRISKVTWKNKASVKIRHLPFTEQSGPSDETTSLQDPSPTRPLGHKLCVHNIFKYFLFIIINVEN
ncbi:uncharacterized protein TNCT_12591 [Trichonephila clavata]|uniref:Uncharacterized protein n=1 Tax=Trichonephila clavata TaxID=2740835 RepID=A0A8X6HH25_TRICU|nr:uncharacterized protein TNCT_12591 [Trichonephila clavata]